MIIVFDTETNGFAGSSVLSISAIKVVDFEVVEEYNRFYYPIEEFNPQAIAVNGLTYDVLSNMRKNATYPEYFVDDLMNFYKFIENATHFIGHNISFDLQFIKPIQVFHTFCTMHANTNIIKIPYKNGYKYPKLLEAANFYNIKYEENNLHGSLYDVYITFKVFKAMFDHNTARLLVGRFIKSNGAKPTLPEKKMYNSLYESYKNAIR
jgi:DNA polymerase-3 subunit epsilon